jgi:hypothetical protein
MAKAMLRLVPLPSRSFDSIYDIVILQKNASCCYRDIRRLRRHMNSDRSSHASG